MGAPQNNAFASADTPVPFEAPAREVMPSFGDASSYNADTPVPPTRSPAPEARPSAGYQDALLQVVRSVHQRTGEVPVGDEVARARLRPTVEQAAHGVAALPAGVTVEQLVREALAEVAGFGAFEPLLDDETVTCVVVDSSGHIAVGRGAAPSAGGTCFSSGDAAASCVRRLLEANGVRHDGASMLRATLRDGARVTVLSAPLSRGVATLIERAPAQPATLLSLSSTGALSAQLAQQLAQAVAARRNVLVAGACASARSALLGALAASVPAGERMVTVTAVGGLGGGRANTVALCADGRWDEMVDVARAMLAPRNVLGEANGATARAFVGGLVSGADGWALGVDAPTAATAVSRLLSLSSQDQWLSREESAQRLHAGRTLVLETARDPDGAPRATGLYEVRDDGRLQRLDG